MGPAVRSGPMRFATDKWASLTDFCQGKGVARIAQAAGCGAVQEDRNPGERQRVPPLIHGDRMLAEIVAADCARRNRPLHVVTTINQRGVEPLTWTGRDVGDADLLACCANRPRSGIAILVGVVVDTIHLEVIRRSEWLSLGCWRRQHASKECGCRNDYADFHEFRSRVESLLPGEDEPNVSANWLGSSGVASVHIELKDRRCTRPLNSMKSASIEPTTALHSSEIGAAEVSHSSAGALMRATWESFLRMTVARWSAVAGLPRVAREIVLTPEMRKSYALRLRNQ